MLQIIQDEGVEAELERGNFDVKSGDSPRCFCCQGLLTMIVTVQLRGDCDISQDELELSLALFSEDLYHHFIELLGIHGLEDLIFHMPCRLPQARRDVHLTQAVPVDANALQAEVLAEMIRCMLAHP